MSDICLRPVVAGDYDRLLEWRSDQRVYRFMHTDRPPTVQEHDNWMLVASTMQGHYIIDHVVYGPVGFCSHSLGDTASLGIYITPEYRGRGFAKDAVMMIIEIAKKAGLKHMKAVVHENNFKAMQLYYKCGFRRTPWVSMEREL